jgi:hypothetical protein
MPAVLERFELVSLCDRRLVDVAPEDELGPRGREGLQDVVPARERALTPRSPWWSRELVVESDDA